MDERFHAARFGLGITTVWVVLALWISPSAFATVGIYSASEDTYTTSDAPASTHGTEDKLKVGHTDSGARQRAYMRFPLPSADRCVSSATLYLSWITPPNGNQFWFGPLDGWWDEDSVNWNRQPDSVAFAEAPFSWSGDGTINQPVGTAVQYAFDQGIQNRGFVLRSRTSGIVDQVKFWSSNYENLNGLYPRLVVDYCD